MNQTLPNSTHPWTRAQDETLRRMLRDKEPVHAISQKLHRHEDAIINRAMELGLTRQTKH